MENRSGVLHEKVAMRWKHLTVLLLSMFLSFSFTFAVSRNSSDSLRNALSERLNDTANIHRYYLLASIADLHKRSQIDSSMSLLNRALAISEATGNTKYLYDIYQQYSIVYSVSGNFPIELDYNFKMLEILDNKVSGKIDSLFLLSEYARLYARIGICYFNMDNCPKALDWYQKSLAIVKRLAILDKTYPASSKLMALYGNIGSAHLSSYNFNEAKFNFEKALELSKSSGNPTSEAKLYNNLGIVYKERKDFNEAFRYYNKSLAIRESLRDTALIAQTCNNLGDAWYLTGDYTKSIEVLNKALNMSRQTGVLSSQMKAANFLSLAYEKTGDYRNALTMQRLFKTLHDSIIGNEQVQQATRLELQYQYEKQRKENELQKQILIAKKERKALIYMILSGILLFSFMILFLLNRNQRMKIRHGKTLQERLALESKNLTLEKQNLQMEKNQLEQELDFRNKELSTHVMYLLRKNEFISSIIDKLLALRKSEDKPLNDTWIQEILREMQSNVDNTVWNEFEMRFQQVHRDFYDKLREKYPDLTPNEIKICAFLKLNMTTKDISAITFQSVKSIQVARNRLRKRMGINRDENLVAAIQQL